MRSGNASPIRFGFPSAGKEGSRGSRGNTWAHVSRTLASLKESQILEGPLHPDHVHMLI